MYEQFTQSARKVIQFANQESQRFNHDYIGVEHGLFAQLRVEWGGAADILRHLVGDVRPVRVAMESVILPGEEDIAILGKLPQTPRMKRAIKRTLWEATRAQSDCVGSEHLLLGLLSITECPAVPIFADFGVTRETILDHLWVIDFDSPTLSEAFELLREWRDRGASWSRIRWSNASLERTLDVAEDWPSAPGCRLDKAFDILERAGWHVYNRECLEGTGPSIEVGPEVIDVVASTVRHRAGSARQ